MRVQFSRYAGISAALAAAVALGACSGAKKANTSTADTTMNRTSAGTTATTSPGALAAPGSTSMASAKLSDANIVALLDEANKADSATAATVLPKLTNSKAKDFARMMMGEHHALRMEGQQLAKKLNITPELPSNDPLQAPVKAEMDSLQGKTGAALDRAYITEEVGIHRDVINLAGQWENDAQNPQLKALIKKAAPVLQKHLERAQAIESSLKTTA